MSEQSGDGFWSRLKLSLEENPLLLVYAGGAGLALLLIIVVILLLFATGGGGNEDIAGGRTPTPTAGGSPTASPSGTLSTPTPTDAGDLPSVTDIAPDLDYFGDLAAVTAQPVTTTFDTSAESLELPDGSTLEVPAGAFSAPTAFTVSIVELQYANYLSTPPDGLIYILSTEVDISLAASVVLAVPKSSDSIIVGEFSGGSWSDKSFEPGDTTRIEMDHFSERTIAVSDETSTNPLRLKAKALLENDVPGDLLLECMSAVTYLFGGPADDDGFLIGVVFEICAQALASTPSSANGVQLKCVSDNLEQGTQAAIDGCAGGVDVTTTPTATPTPQPTQQTQAATASPTKNPVSGTLAPGVLSSTATIDGSCAQENESADITCTYNVAVKMDYDVTDLPAQIRCAIMPQIPNFNPIQAGILDLSSDHGVVTVTTRASAVFDADGTPLFSTPTLVECVLRRPIGAGEFNDLDSILIDVSLPGPNI